MNDSTEPSVAGAARPFPSNIYLPKTIYEALPAGYISVGALFILGAVYIGIGHWPMAGYLAVGVSCILVGVTVNSIRNRERAKSEDASA